MAAVPVDYFAGGHVVRVDGPEEQFWRDCGEALQEFPRLGQVRDDGATKDGIELAGSKLISLEVGLDELNISDREEILQKSSFADVCRPSFQPDDSPHAWMFGEHKGVGAFQGTELKDRFGLGSETMEMLDAHVAFGADCAAVICIADAEPEDPWF